MGITAFGGYHATQSDGELVVHDVPIFCECTRDDMVFDADWIRQAVKEAKLSESEGYLPPMHTRHHEPGVEPRFAGVYRIKGTKTVSMKGQARLAVIADLIFRDPHTIGEVLARRFPYRSVEIFNVNKPKLDGLALLDHEAPFLELPMLEIAGVQPGPTRQKFGALDWHMDGTPDEAVLAHFRRGSTAHFLFREDGAMAESDAKKEYDEEDSVNMECASDDSDKSENMEADGGGTIDASAVISAIEDGSISIADFDAIQAAMQARMGSVEAEPEAEEISEDEMPAPASIPVRDAMRAQPDPKLATKMARMQGKIDALEAAQKEYEKREKQRTAEVQRKDDIAAAMKRLENRPLGDVEKLEAKLVKFHRDYGRAPFLEYVDSMAEAVPEWTGRPGEKMSFNAGKSHATSSVAMKYQEHGPEAVTQAQRCADEWRQLHETGHTRKSEEQYVAAFMRRMGLNGSVNHG